MAPQVGFDPTGADGRAFDLAGITKTVGAPFLLVSCEEPALSLSKGRESEMPAPSGFDHVSTTKSNSTRSIAVWRVMVFSGDRYPI